MNIIPTHSALDTGPVCLVFTHDCVPWIIETPSPNNLNNPGSSVIKNCLFGKEINEVFVFPQNFIQKCEMYHSKMNQT